VDHAVTRRRGAVALAISAWTEHPLIVLAGVLGIAVYGSLGGFLVSVVGAMILIGLLRAVR